MVESEIKSKLLKRQLEKVRKEDGSIDTDQFIKMIDWAYEDAESERRMTNRSLELMSSELLESNQDLRHQAEELIASQERLKEVGNKLTSAARFAGMAEVATNVLHNIGNILNSVNTTATLLTEKIGNSKLINLVRLKDLLLEHENDLALFLTEDPKGKMVPQFVKELADHWQEKQKILVGELEQLKKNVDHIKDCIIMQQTMAQPFGMVEPVNLKEMIESILDLQWNWQDTKLIQVKRDYESLSSVLLDRVKLYQILVNLIQNAKQAVFSSEKMDKIVNLSFNTLSDSRIQIRVGDNGIGIPPQLLTKIFSHGFTTKKDGHGFGLHYCANAAKEMGGDLNVESEGLGHGATFVLTLPFRSLD